MKHSRTLALVFALLLTLTARAQTTTIGPKTRVETVQFKSKLVGATLPYQVVLPASYAAERKGLPARYPVLYLLHGFTGHYDNWLSKTKLVEYVSSHDFNFIIITPEGNNGWYTDSATVPADKYESYILQELIPDVQSHYRTIESREGRAIAGLSMGGYGALKFGVKHPEVFAFAASLSGALDAAVWTENDLRNFGPELPRSIMETFGPPGSQTRAANDLSKLVRDFPAERIKELPYFYLDCGTEDGLLSFSRNLSALFVERKIPHEFRQLPGTHNWTYWDAQVREVLRVAAQKIPQARASAVARRSSSFAHPSLPHEPRQRFSRA